MPNTVKIDFEFQTKYGVFRDALHLPEDHGYTQEQISEMQAERLNNWLYSVENPPAPEPETVEIDGITYEKIEIDGQVVLKPVEV
jgi:MOSC domain-containing protein YiiM